MDVYCPKCGEPVEIDTLHEYAESNEVTFQSVLDSFKKNGCGETFTEWGWQCNPSEHGKERAMIASELFDILGDDIDGIASTIDDWEYLTR